MAGDVVVVATEPTQKENEDNFAAAFNQITEADNAPVVAEAKTPPAVEVKPVEPVVTPVEGELPPTDEEKAAATAAEAAKTAPVADAKPTISEEDILRRLGSMLGRTETPVQEAVQPAEEPKSSFTQEETGLLDAYVKDYPDIARAEALIRRSEYQAVVGYVFTEISKELQPMVQMLRTLSERTHLGDLQTAVPDYATTREQVIAWVEKQPGYVKSAYQNVIKQGTVAEVADLIDRYKQANPAPVTQEVPVAQKGVTTAQAAPIVVKPAVQELSPAAKKAVAALAPVNSKRTNATVVANDPNDFEAAFASFAKELG